MQGELDELVRGRVEIDHRIGFAIGCLANLADYEIVRAECLRADDIAFEARERVREHRQAMLAVAPAAFAEALRSLRRTQEPGNG